jgi:LysR family glycine cleavage system transcriptional activator
VIAAVLASLGSGLLPRYLIEKEIEKGVLVTLADEELVTQNNYYLVTPINQDDQNVEKFYEWITEQAAISSVNRVSHFTDGIDNL